MTKLFPLILLGLAACTPNTESNDGSANQTMAQQAEAVNVSWKMVTTWPKNMPALGVAPERLASKIDAMSNGRFKIKVFGDGELVSSGEVFDTVSGGSAEMGHSAAYYWRGKIPIAALFTTIPFGMTAQELNGWLHYGGGLELWQELYAPFNLRPMAGGNSGVQMAGWFNKEIRSLEDFQGLTMRIPGLGGEAMSQAGAVTVALPGIEIFTSLSTGAIDATEWIGPYNDLAFGLQDIAKYYYYPGWHEPGANLEFLVNMDAWNALPADFQAMLEVAARAINQDVLDELTVKNSVALQTLLSEHSVELRELPADVLSRLHEISKALLDDTAGDDPLAQKIVKSYKDYMERMRLYSNISEYAYMKARER